MGLEFSVMFRQLSVHSFCKIIIEHCNNIFVAVGDENEVEEEDGE